MEYRYPRFALFTFLIISLFISGCGNSDEINRELEISVVNEFMLSESTQEYLYRMYPSVAGNPVAEELAFSNYLSPVRIVITDYQGEFVETVGIEGRGPEEIIDARFFGFDDRQNLVILDKAGGLFKYFNRTTGEVISYDYPIKSGISVTSRKLQMCGDKWYTAVQLLEKSTDRNVPVVGVFDTEFNVVDTLGGYDPFFNGRAGILQDPDIEIDCDNRRIYTTHGKVPYIQVFSMDNKERIGRTSIVPPSFMLSDEFITMVTDGREWTRFLTEEQSLSLGISYTDHYIYHIFRNEGGISNSFRQSPDLNEREHYVAVYDKESLEYLGETQLPGAVLGSTKEGSLIVLKNELTFEFQFVEITPVPGPEG